MANNYDRLAATEHYIAEQARAVDAVPEEEIQDFVLSSIHKLAAKHFEPTVHALSDGVPNTTIPWISSLLYNGVDPVLVNPSLEDVLPVHYREDTAASRRNELLLPSDDGPLKIQTQSDYPTPGSFVLMKVTNYGHASEKQAEDYRQNRALLNDIIPADATILMPKSSINYYQYPEPGLIMCGYENPNEADTRIHFYSQSTRQLSPEDFLTLHSGFMDETRAALMSLRSLLP